MGISIIIGMGEVGRAVNIVMSGYHETVTYDNTPTHFAFPPKVAIDVFKVLHICIPYSNAFIDIVREYQEYYEPTYTIIHSTVPVGTCKALDVFHSPIRGVHPYLAESLTVFTTYLAPKNTELKEYLQQAGMEVQCVADSRTTEAGKLWSLMAYAMNITLEKEMYDWCVANDVDYAVAYKHFTHTYNNGYTALGMENYTRPVLEHMEGPIGGHCIIPGVEKLQETYMAQLILERNGSLNDTT